MVQERIMLGEERARMLEMLGKQAKEVKQLHVCCKRPCKMQRGTHTDLIIGTVHVTLGAVAGGLYYLGHF